MKMTNRRFDFGTAGFILAIICLGLLWYEVKKSDPYISRIHRIEASLRAICAGESRTESCAVLGLPIELPKFQED